MILKSTFLYYLLMEVCGQPNRWTTPPKAIHYTKQISLNDVYKSYIKEIEGLNPKTTEVKSIGNSFLGKPISAIEIRHSTYYAGTVLIDAGQNGNEWQSVNMALYFLREILVKETGLLVWIKIVVIPLVNPDGYEIAENDANYSTNVNGDDRCPGVNIAMNFDVGPQPIFSDCNSYQGKKYSSEPETINLKNYIKKLGDVKLYITLHSNHEAFIGIPFAKNNAKHSSAKMSGNIHKAVTDKLKDVEVKTGSLSEIFSKEFGGSALDWVCAIANVDNCIYMSLSNSQGNLENQLEAFFHGIKYAIIQYHLTDTAVAMAFSLECMHHKNVRSQGNYLKLKIILIYCIILMLKSF
ncbi:carboxypeptidase B1-like [Onthophagus taurus]|uniref:carboxypeptidase B1-like n=1 Tax=Onthophagus taurus TaxID=166361 RepID=UPI0039BEC9E3